MSSSLDGAETAQAPSHPVSFAPTGGRIGARAGQWIAATVRQPRRIRWPEVLAALGLWFATVVVRELAVWGVAAWSARTAGLDSVRRLVVAGSGDEVYSRLILGMVGSIRVKGLAVRWPFEGALSGAAPDFFVSSSYLTPGGWIGVVFADGSSVVGVHLVQVLVNALMVLAGSVLFLVSGLRPLRFARGDRFAWFARLPGALCLACGIGGEMQLSWSSGTGGEMALSMVATKVVGLDSHAYDAALKLGWLISLAVNIMIVAIAVLIGLLLTRGAAMAWRRSWRRSDRSPRFYRVRLAMLLLALVAVFYASTSHAVAFEQARFRPAPAPPRQTRLAAIVSRWPSVVTVAPRRDGAGWEYRVNGRPQYIRGFGYNAVDDDATPAERAQRLDRDFSAISDAGGNTIVGWYESLFNDQLMQKAADHGLGVILPFELESGYAYEDPRARQELMDAIIRRVERYRNSPALRIWGLGNEVLHEIARARGTQLRYDSFASFVVQAADRIHEIDPNHPVVYRDAEDWYSQAIIKALADGKSRPWFIYGMNFFTVRMDQALTSGPTSRTRQPLLISEFGPVGLRPDDRPNGYLRLWDIIRAHSDRVLGGLAYVWTTAGPEPLDRNFGLTDASGQPVDGSLAALSSEFLTERQRDESAG